MRLIKLSFVSARPYRMTHGIVWLWGGIFKFFSIFNNIRAHAKCMQNHSLLYTRMLSERNSCNNDVISLLCFPAEICIYRFYDNFIYYLAVLMWNKKFLIMIYVPLYLIIIYKHFRKVCCVNAD